MLVHNTQLLAGHVLFNTCLHSLLYFDLQFIQGKYKTCQLLNPLMVVNKYLKCTRLSRQMDTKESLYVAHTAIKPFGISLTVLVI